LINVIAGVNGAGKSSVLGNWIRANGSNYFNPDEVTRQLMAESPDLSLNDANIKAWEMNFEKLGQHIDANEDYAFETTLGGNSIPAELQRAIDLGVEVSIYYCGLESPELHIARVAARVANGGHDIPEAKIRYRWTNSVHNLMALLPGCTEVIVYDNSAELVDGKPSPKLLFSLVDGFFADMPSADMPEWAKPLAQVAMTQHMETLASNSP